MKLYKHQARCVSELHGLFKVNRAVCLAWYTGAGKTNILSQFVKECLNKDPGIKVGIWSYLTTEIRDQISERLTEFGLKDKHSVVTRFSKDVSKPIVVFNPQSVVNKDLKVKFDLFIIDEGHVGVSEACKMIKVIKARYCTKKTNILLVSATPWDTLAMREYKGIPVLKRSLEAGLEDGLINDVRIHAEEANVEFDPKDFNRVGDLTSSAINSKMSVVKSACEAKLSYLLKKYDKDLGKKVLVVCPPGNFGEVARNLAKKFNGLPYLQESIISSLKNTGLSRKELETNPNLEKFKNDETRFLFVVNKCGVGFDMKNLSSVIDLTMTRNVRTLVQRIGRVARKDGNKPKSYFYVYDKSLLKDRLEWLLCTVIDFGLGAYDGFTTRTAKYHRVDLRKGHQFASPFSSTIKEIVHALKADGAIETRRILKCVDYDPPEKWTLDKAKEAALKYQDRTEMWEKRPALYKWFRLNAKSEMDKIFPLKHRLGKWHMKSVTELMKRESGKLTRNQFKGKYRGVLYFLDVKIDKAKRAELLDKYFPLQQERQPEWTEERAIDVLKNIRKWSRVKGYGRLLKWMEKNGGVKHWQEAWVKLHAGRVAVRQRKTGALTASRI